MFLARGRSNTEPLFNFVSASWGGSHPLPRTHSGGDEGQPLTRDRRYQQSLLHVESCSLSQKLVGPENCALVPLTTERITSSTLAHVRAESEVQSARFHSDITRQF